MTNKKRLSLDLDLDKPWEKIIWDYLEDEKIKSKAIKKILFAYIEGNEIEIKKSMNNKVDELKKDDKSKILNKEEIDPSIINGFN